MRSRRSLLIGGAVLLPAVAVLTAKIEEARRGLVSPVQGRGEYQSTR